MVLMISSVFPQVCVCVCLHSYVHTCRWKPKADARNHPWKESYTLFISSGSLSHAPSWPYLVSLAHLSGDALSLTLHIKPGFPGRLPSSTVFLWVLEIITQLLTHVQVLNHGVINPAPGGDSCTFFLLFLQCVQRGVLCTNDYVTGFSAEETESGPIWK